MVDISPNQDDVVIKPDQEDFQKLSDMKVPELRELLTEQNLYDTGLRPSNSLSKGSESLLLPRLVIYLTCTFFVSAMRIVSVD